MHRQLCFMYTEQINYIALTTADNDIMLRVRQNSRTKL